MPEYPQTPDDVAAEMPAAETGPTWTGPFTVDGPHGGNMPFQVVSVHNDAAIGDFWTAEDAELVANALNAYLGQ